MTFKRKKENTTIKETRQDVNRRLTLIVATVLVIVLGLIAYFGISGCIGINQQNYLYIKSVAKEESVAIDNEFDAALKNIEGYAMAMSEGLDVEKYREYMPFDRGIYIEADSGDADKFKDLDFVKMGLQGKSGTEIDFDKKLCDEVSLIFYAPVVQGDRVEGVLVGQYLQESMATQLQTDCYGTEAVSFLTTSDGNIVFSSKGAEEYIGTNLFTQYYKTAEIVSTSLDELTREEKTFIKLANAMYNGGNFGYTIREKARYETTYVVSLNHEKLSIAKTFPGSVSFAMISRQLGIVFVMMLVLIFITVIFVVPLIKRYSKYQQMQLAASQAEAANEAKSDFLSRMSHDMRTPLNGILGMTDIAIRHIEDTGRTKDCLEKIKSSGNYLLNLVNEVLDLNSISSGRIELKESVVYIPKIQEEERIMVSNFLAGKQLEITYKNMLIHECVIADATALKKISLNLLSNAIKYTPAGGTITVSYWEEKNDELPDSEYRWFYISVEDSGIGMSEGFMEKMFNPYEREEDVRVSKTQGTGLGLPIVKALAEKMQGNITVKSEEGKGSTFTVRLLLKLAGSSEAGKPEVQETSLEEIDCTGLRCLLVEDNELNLEIAKELLLLSSITIETAKNGEEALDMFCSKPEEYYNIIFMDVQMPVMDGYTATRKIRNTKRNDAGIIPIIAMTANAYEKDVSEAFDAGMNDHLAKPVEQKKLAAVLCRYLGVRSK